MASDRRRLGGTCAIGGRPFIREVRESAGHSWSCPYCHTKQTGPTALDALARRERRKHCLAVLRARDERDSASVAGP
jgi:hypothetical protein